MALAKEKPLYAEPTDIESDWFLWCFEQAELLRHRRFGEADLPNLIEELESMGKSQYLKLLSNYTVVLAHLLKWRVEPAMRGKSWRLTLREHRRRIAKQEAVSPSLRARAHAIVDEAYRDALADAADETELPRSAFPAQCPFTLDEIRDPEFLPEGETD